MKNLTEAVKRISRILLWQLPHPHPGAHTSTPPSPLPRDAYPNTDSSTPSVPWFPCPDLWLSSTNCHGIFSEDIPLILPHRVLPLPLGMRSVKPPPKGSLHRILLGRKALVAPQPLYVPTRGRPRHFQKADAGFFFFFF